MIDVDTGTCSIYETITVALSKTFLDGEVGFTGLTTGAQAVLYGTSMPLAAMALARVTHAPALTTLFAGWSINPDLTELRRLPDLEFASEFIDLPAEAQVTGYPNAIGYKSGDVDVGFSSGAQIDRFGSLNSVAIGEPQRPRVRLVGPILQPIHFTHFGRAVVMMPRHDLRTFVDRVDYRSGVGHQVDGRTRADLGLPVRTGPYMVVSPLGFFDFSGPGHSMRAVSLHPGVSREQAAESTGFEIDALHQAPTTPLPIAEELRLLRRHVDPRHILVPSVGHNLNEEIS